MGFFEEFNYAFIVLIIVFLVYILSAFTKNIQLKFMVALFSTIIGSMLIVFGFWGSDFAFGVALGHIKQEKERGKVKGVKNKVYVPFMKNYTSLEWWNLNWFITTVGIIFFALGMFIVGLIVSPLII